ncbi:HD family hydrolase [Actinomadura sp. 6N118]|uniref:HD family hydrolase n=1 Tax=Actinomadura sp. 6N118 TaxID=3375151 RepID=UPI00379B1A1C
MAGDPGLSNLVLFLFESGYLKRAVRQGWQIAGVAEAESVAEHSFRAAVIGYAVAVLEGADPERTAVLCLFRYLPEARLTYVPSTEKLQLAEAVIAHQASGLPVALRDRLRWLIAEIGDGESPEAMCARDADALECLLQAREYDAIGELDAQPWIATMVAAVQTSTGKNLAAAACETQPVDWWNAIVASYGRPAGQPVE